MESKKINQLATNVAPVSTDLTIIGDPITGVSKKITLLQLASIFSGSIAFYTNYAAFPATGTVNTIYCAKDTNKLYLWSGSAYVETFPSQALLDTYQLRSEKGVSNGYASLDSAGKVPISQLPSSIMEYKGMWSATTNTPTLANGTGDTGDVYICNGAGSVNFGAGAITFAVGDYVVYSGTIWQRSSGAVGTVTSVGLSSATSGVTIGSSPITTSGTITLAIANATTSQNGLLTSTDWATFNGKFNLPSLTSGSVLFSNGTTISQNNANFFWDNTNVRLGVGTASPSAGVTVYSTTAATQFKAAGVAPAFTFSDTLVSSTYAAVFGLATSANHFITGTATGDMAIANQSTSAGAIVFGTGTTEKMRMTSTGTFSIGNTNSTYKLDVTGTVRFTGELTGSSAVFSSTVRPSSSLLADLGSSSFRWNDIYGFTLNLSSSLTALSIIKSGGTSSQFLKADGSVDSTSYQAALTNPVTGTGTQNYHTKWNNAGGTSIGNSLIWDNGTNVGIGNTNTSYTLDVSGTGRFTATSSTPALKVTLVANANATLLSSVDGSGYGWELQQEEVSTGDFRIFRSVASTKSQVLNLTRSTGAATFSSTITSGGTISVNPTSVGFLTLGASANYGSVSSGGGGATLYMNGSTRGGTGGATSSCVTLATDSFFQVTDSSTNNAKFTVDNNGRVSIGSTSYGAATIKLMAYQTADQHVISSYATTGNANACFFSRVDSTTNVFNFFSYGATIIGSINTSAGTSVNYNTTYSDKRLKKNFENWDESVINLFKDINPQKFNLNNQQDSDEKIKGFIAQEMVDKFPEAYPIDNDGFYCFNPSGMVVYLMKAIQEQNQTIQSLQEQINILAK